MKMMLVSDLGPHHPKWLGIGTQELRNKGHSCNNLNSLSLFSLHLPEPATLNYDSSSLSQYVGPSSITLSYCHNTFHFLSYNYFRTQRKQLLDRLVNQTSSLFSLFSSYSAFAA
ncbi:hypothetical protein RIF29_29606 [Crotalaria pallida]|uniref:Uncharacterized protein n=1 Tax=Crotalaria pallida TaxID=3830 RepID=A0AAN9EEV3_CROPI